ncbi:MAG: monomethylamine:corrinoid methyltransferase [Chloroflexota bacterium]|nr:monomethylamine:corrinoid methyltransferase [Chloroflexota bacterium]
MASIEYALKILDKAHTGPICTAKDWGFRLSKTIAEKLKKHGLEKTCDTQNPVPTDDGLVDRFYKAGYELALEMGVFCQDTDRIITLTEEQIDNAIRNAPAKLRLGKGSDMVTLKHRRPEDTIRPLSSSPMGHLITEDVYVLLHQGIAQHREIDMLRSGTLGTMFGRPVLAGSPYETAVGMYQARLTKEALWRAGRPGMSNMAIASSPTAYGQMGGFTYGGCDPEVDVALILAPGELTTSFEVLHKMVHAINCGAKMTNGYSSMIGGYPGRPEGAAMVRIATIIHQYVVHQTDFYNGSVTDVRYLGNCGREGQWAEGISTQAISRNTLFCGVDVQNQLAGPCTEMLLYESAVAMVNLSASGAAGYLGPRTSGSKYANHITPLECKFCAEVLKGAAGLTRKQANEIAKVLIPKYEADLYNPHIGKSFKDCYDLKTLEPTKEWLDIYLKIKKELIDLGVHLE